MPTPLMPDIATSRTQQETPARKPAVTPGAALFVGVSGVGKSVFIRSIPRAVSLNPPGNERLACQPNDVQTARLWHELPSVVLDGNRLPKATEDVYQYSARLQLIRNGVCQRSCDIEVTDSPGGVCFPLPDQPVPGVLQDKIRTAASRASALVLCIDIVNPQVSQVNRWLPELILNFRNSRRTGLEDLLILFTKADKLTASWLGAAKASIRDRSGKALREQFNDAQEGIAKHDTPASLAMRLSPIGYARQLGPEILGGLLGALEPGAKLAVGVCSALGFDVTGGQFIDDASHAPLLLATETRESKYRDWVPFGVRDVLMWLLTRRSQGMIRELGWDDFAHDPAASQRLPYLSEPR